MEYLRNLPSKTNAFSTASYERVRGGPHNRSRPYFTTQDQTPKQVQASSDENLILAAIRHKKQITTIEPDTSKRPTTDFSVSGSSEESPQPPRLYKRPRIALSNAAAAATVATVSTNVINSQSPSSSSTSSSPSSS